VSTLTDPVHLEVPDRAAVQPAAPVDGAMHVPSDPTQRSFHLESRGGYLRKIRGSIAYIDEEARTYMVRTGDGLLVRVPIREIHDPVVVALEGVHP
jgi:hypothetical protein